jgi:hypothetical protein
MSKTRWAVAAQSRHSAFDWEVATATCRYLEQLGQSASIVHDGDETGLTADVLLFLINLGHYPAYCQKLRHSGSRRPKTILWQMDPLPSPTWPAEAVNTGLEAARWKGRFGLHQSSAMPRWKKLCTLFRLRQWASHRCSAPGFRSACRIIDDRHDGLDWMQVRGVMSNWRVLVDSHKEGWIDHYVMSTHQRFHFLAGHGIAAHFVPMGACEEMGRDLGLTRDQPVGFLGHIKYGRRAQMLASLGERLRQRGIPLTRVVDDCYGEQRLAWLNRTRILINLHSFSWNPAWIRFLFAAACGTLVVSEPMNDEHPMVAGVHYIAATQNEMPDVICDLLKEPERIHRLTAAASDLCHRELTLFRSVERLSELIPDRDLKIPCLL